MKLIDSKVENISQVYYGLDDVYRQIEKAARTCYKSEDKITNNSAEPFVKMLIDRGHTAMLEHGIIILKLGHDLLCDVNQAEQLSALYANPHTHVTFINDDYDIIVTNYRVIIENHFEWTLKYITHDYDTLIICPSFRITCDNGVARELTRHRVFSFAQESSRYCNYTKDKFGGELTFIKPWWWNDLSKAQDETVYNNNKKLGQLMTSPKASFELACRDAEHRYKKIIEAGMPAQAARAVIPLCGKTELVMTGHHSLWTPFFQLRTAPGAHPDMKKVALEIKSKMDGVYYL